MSFQFKYRRYAEILYEALREDAFYITLEQNISDTASAKETMVRYFDYSIEEGQKYGQLFIPNEPEYGISVWSKPLNPELEAKKAAEKKDFLLNYMGQESLHLYNQVVTSMSKNATSLIDENAWYLSIVGVLPKFQGKGLGIKLVKEVLELSDALAVPTYLETFTARNRSFYQRLGYQVMESFYEPTVQARYWLMVREYYK